MKREEKLKLLKDFKSINTNKFEWDVLNPDEKGDWINHRNNSFDDLIAIEPDKKFNNEAESVFNMYAIGLNTGRDYWTYNYSLSLLSKEIFP